MARRRRLTKWGITLLVCYGVIAYIVVPLLWRRYETRHPALADLPNITETKNDIPGDPLNFALIGTQTEVMRILVAAKWYPSDPLTLKSCLEIAEATVLKHQYETAPVSNLYLWGRKQDLAFEQPVGANPRQRHHVRFWRSEKVDADGRPLWVGAAIYDKGVELSHTTGQITHKTDGDIDVERDYLAADLLKTGQLKKQSYVDDFHKVREGKNGGGDRWHTDGRLAVDEIQISSAP
ncbi:MAG: LssY C-terminal domain-containing protein [Planctomycetota bacterium]|nr:LssY C-terminal domain-containing protein [Planctomycetota bacterium]